MAVTANQPIKARYPDKRQELELEGTVYQGTIVLADASTGKGKGTATGTDIFFGIAVKDGVSGDTIDCYQDGIFQLPFDSVAQTDVGLPAYVVDNFAVDGTATSQTHIGTVVGVAGTNLAWVKIEVTGTVAV